MTIDQMEKKVAMMEKFAPLVRTLSQSLGGARSFDRVLSQIKTIRHEERERVHRLYNAMVRIATVQAEMWRGRSDGMEN